MTQPGVNYYVQVATNLTAPVYWRTLQSIYYASGGTYQVSDYEASTNAVRFYRVLAQ